MNPWKNYSLNKLPFDPAWKIRTLDLHTAGEPLRVIVDGLPPIPGNTVLEKRTFLMNRYDSLRKLLMWEPRGHTDMYGCIITEPNDNGADFGVIFIHNEGYSTMCGHAIIALGRLHAIQMGITEGNISVDAPCGRIEIEIMADQIRFIGVPSFVVNPNLSIDVPEINEPVQGTLAYGGAYYIYLSVPEDKYPILPSHYTKLKSIGYQIKQEHLNSLQIEHPFESDLSFLYGTILSGGPRSPEVDVRNVCVFADAEVDRCPTGSGVMGRLAIEYTQGTIGLNEWITVESILGTQFKGRVIDSVEYGPYQAIIPQISGNAYLTGEHCFIVDPSDPLREGFLFSDI